MKSCLGHKNFFVVLVLMAVLGFGAEVAKCETIIVKADGTGDYPTIQEAINASINGDIIELQPGTYTGVGNRNIDFKGKAITVRSTDPNDSDIVAATTINCQGIDGELRRGFYFHNGEGTDSVLSGLTITNGYADGSWPANNGGAIYCTNSNPTIEHCRMISNRAEHHGGGIYCSSSSPNIHDCTISDNRVDSWFGGGVYCIRGNPVITDCMISNNAAVQGGGGIYCRQTNVSVSRCNIKDNHCQSSGGGIYFFQCGDPRVSNCLISDNTSDGAAAIIMVEGHPKIEHCTVINNNGGPYLGSIYCNNQEGGTGTITNSIVWDNSGWWQIRGNLNVSFCDVGKAGYSGEGNIDADPCFVETGYWDANGIWVDGDYHLLSGSPCIDAGADAGVYDDIEGNVRPFDYPGVDNNGELPEFDMGAYEAIYINTTPVACIVGGDKTVEAGSDCEARVTLDGSCSSDADSTPGTNDDINDFDWYEVIDPCDPNSDILLGSGEIIECNLPLGEHIIVLEVTDKACAFDVNEVTIIVEDTTTPEFALSVSPDTLWPANHKMVEITPSWEVSDNCDGKPDVTLVSISSNEDDDSKGDGRTSDDIQISANGSIYLRAERSGTGSGRVYTITYQAVDDSGNVTVESATVTVPHDKRRAK